MTIGMIFGAIIEYSNAMHEAREDSDVSNNIVTRKATAEDYIAF